MLIFISLSAPGVVIYDYACGLHNYCLNREPKFFQETKFLIDRYHQPNHKGEVLDDVTFLKISSLPFTILKNWLKFLSWKNYSMGDLCMFLVPKWMKTAISNCISIGWLFRLDTYSPSLFPVFCVLFVLMTLFHLK